MIRSILFIFIVGTVIYFSTTLPASAYIDPGSGSFLLQIIGAAIVGVLFYIRSFRQWLQSLFSKKIGTKSKSENE
tara:strand:+ start:608 stop:832 length:225 start_codon:yes stop_codon:yes gene_type:complete